MNIEGCGLNGTHVTEQNRVFKVYVTMALAFDLLTPKQLHVVLFAQQEHPSYEA